VNRKRLGCIVFVFVFVCAAAAPAEFGAYYCKLDSGESWESGFRAGPFADVMVRLGEGDDKLVFWRASSYLPFWETSRGRWYLEEMVPRNGDGSDQRPDKICRFSRVRIIENSPARAIVHWRYVPDFGNANQDGFVDEYFTVYPDGVLMRTVRKGEAKLDEWLDPANVTVQSLQLVDGGINGLAAEWKSIPELSLTGAAAESFDNLGFDNSKRCYLLKCRKNETPSTLSFALDTSGGKLIHNPAIVVQNWGDAAASVLIDGKASGNHRAGYIEGAKCTAFVLWLGVESQNAISVSVSPRGGGRPTNRAPHVDAGRDRSILLPAGSSSPYFVNLAAVVDDDGLPNDNLINTWSNVSGPGSAEFNDSHSTATGVSLSAEGTYSLRLSSDDGSKSGRDDLIIVLKKEPAVTVAPAAWWKFDEASGNTAAENVSGAADPIAGNKTLWTAGISGSGLIFDGYTSVVTHPRSQTPAISNGFTLEAWIVIKAYPWNWCPIVHQSRWENSGYFLGVDARGHLGLMASIGGWQSLTSGSVVGRNRWVHVAGTFDKSAGRMTIYIDGSEAGSKSVSQSSVSTANQDIRIGKGEKMSPTDYIRISTPAEYAFDGIIDEVKIYDRPLGGSEVADMYNANKPDPLVRDHPAIQQRILPRGTSDLNRFGAYYTNLRFHHGWDNMWRVSEHPDVVVRFDEPYRLVFWKGTSYIPHWSSENNKWYNNEFLETNEGGLDGCGEPMSDKMCRHSHVRIIENTDARVVVHWRYGLVDAHDNFGYVNSAGWGDWGDEYHYIYPDGVVVRQQHLWSSALDEWHEYQEAIIVHGPEQRPEDNIELDAVHMARMDGAKHVYSWHDGPPMDPLPWPEGATIQITNLKAEYDPFAIVSPSIYEVDCATSEMTSASVFPWWNHWPVAQIPSDGRYAYEPDRTSHSTVTNLKWRSYKKSGDLEIKLLLHGMTNKPAEQLVSLNRSWEYPPRLDIESDGFSGGEYDKAERAYKILRTSPEAGVLRCRLNGSSESPVANASLVIENWETDGAELMLDGEVIEPGADFRTGVVENADGVASLIVWFRKESTSAVNVELSASAGIPADFNDDRVVNFLDFAIFVQGEDWLITP